MIIVAIVLDDISYIYHFPKQQILKYSKLKEFPDDNFKFNENCRKFSQRVENTVRKREIARNDSVFKRPVLQTRKIKGLFSKGLFNYNVYNQCFQLLTVFFFNIKTTKETAFFIYSFSVIVYDLYQLLIFQMTV